MPPQPIDRACLSLAGVPPCGLRTVPTVGVAPPVRCPWSGGDQDGALTLSWNRSAAGRPIIKMPMTMESPRWSSIIVWRRSPAGRLIRYPCSGGDQDGALTLRMEEVGCWSTYKMPMPMESPRLNSTIIMEEVGCWSTYKMPVPMESPRWSFAIIMEEVGCWSTLETSRLSSVIIMEEVGYWSTCKMPVTMESPRSVTSSWIS